MIERSTISNQTFFARAPVACILTDLHGTIVDANSSFEQLSGYTKAELIGQSREVLQLAQCNDQACEEACPGHEFELMRKDGQSIRVELQTQRVASGKKTLVLGIARETVVSRDKSTLQLLRAVLDGLPQAVFWKDRLSRFLGGNRAAADFVGLDSPEELVGMADADLVDSEEEAQQCYEWDQRVMQSDHADYHIVEPMETPDGKSLWLDRTRIPLHSPSGEVSGVVVAIDDVTQRVEAEEESKRLLKQLQHAQKMEAIGELAAGVAHEFNNLLAVMRGNAELMLFTQEMSDPVEAAFKEIERGCERASLLTGQLLSFARRKRSEVTVFDVRTVVDNCAPMFRRMIGRELEFAVHVSSDDARVRANESELENALLNLTLNARDAIDEKGMVSIRVDRFHQQETSRNSPCNPGRYIRISVSDDGCGMSEETMSRAFDPFFTTKPRGQGTGLGLSTVYSDILKHEGFAEIDSKLGEGTTVHLYLPQVDAPVGAEKNVGAQDRRGGDETILVCDDEEMVLASLLGLLQSCGYNAVGAASGDEAMAKAGQIGDDIALLITDITMPDMGGVELAGRFSELHPDAKVIYSSGYLADRFALENVGENNFWEKGKPTSQMLEQIRRVLDGE